MSGSDARQMISFRRGGRARAVWWHSALIYAGVVVASLLLADLSFHSPGLANTRLGLNFALLLAVAILWRWGPALAAVAGTLLGYHHYRLDVPQPGHDLLTTVVPVFVLLFVGAEVVLLIWRSELAGRQLQAAMTDLSENSDALMQAQQASGAAVWTFDTAANTARWYEGGAPIYGKPNPPGQSLDSVMDMIFEEDRDRVGQAMEVTRSTGRPFIVEYRTVWPSGEVHWLEARGTMVGGNPNHWRGVTLDITERKRAENALLQTEKLAVAGRLAAAIAHEINNPLEAITNLCYLARSTADEVTGRYIAMAEEELRRVAHITSQTLRFHKQQSAAGATDLREIIESLLGLYEPRLRRNKVAVSLEAHAMPELFCFAGEIRQVMANLIGNALDAMEDGGTLRIRLGACTAWRAGAKAARITISDSGHGIPALTLAHIYEPFFTTKTDMGTGLGLWVSTTLIEKHGGQLWVRSNTDPQKHGTVFSVVLPYESPVSRQFRPSAESSIAR